MNSAPASDWQSDKSAQLFHTVNEVYGLSIDPQSKKRDELIEEVEDLLKKYIQEGDRQAIFLLGQLYYEESRYEEAFLEFAKVKDTDLQALYQLSVMYYDGLGIKADCKKAVEYMSRISTTASLKTEHLKYAALYNLGRAYFEGFGVKQSDEEAERLWLLAADDGNPKASIKAQTALGLFYCRPDTLDLKKAFFWHSEACGNGSLESQGALGVMYLYGYGIPQDTQAAFECLKEASERGNVYAQGHLITHYYNKKLYSRAAELAKRMSKYENIPEIARATDCRIDYIRKGLAIALFYYARCLQLGLGATQNSKEAQYYYSKAALLDPDVVADLQTEVNHGIL
ncbi:LRP2-binding protein isoform X1 [Polypterus senegalus]|uniref:LRP2-binding protein isoform X1 n=1 Tax=Polypterus senegalus TaxID=55291 RepID=UPI00196315D2|nr:LRP2-binding protein isoform X1 [Polypterus senegalus]XP_039606933.1 LRP2-binding protein isoform X1 [Polypterus senegalus]